jgi:hypothetical protein
LFWPFPPAGGVVESLGVGDGEEVLGVGDGDADWTT